MSGEKKPTSPKSNGGESSAKEIKTKCSSLDKAIKIIENSSFSKTKEGKKVLAKIKKLRKDGKINFKPLSGGTRGEWSGAKGEITVNQTYNNDPDSIASELVHEATHALNEDEFPKSKKKLTIDEEVRTNENQLALYEDQRKSGFRDSELERRRKAKKKGKLRDDVRSRYKKGTPEHL